MTRMMGSMPWSSIASIRLTFGEASGRHDEAPLQVAAHHQFSDEQARHDRLACTGVIGEQEAHGLPGQHLLG